MTGGGQLKYFWNLHPENWGNDPISLKFFSNGLKPPTSVVVGFNQPNSKNYALIIQFGESFFPQGSGVKKFPKTYLKLPPPKNLGGGNFQRFLDGNFQSDPWGEDWIQIE